MWQDHSIINKLFLVCLICTFPGVLTFADFNITLLLADLGLLFRTTAVENSAKSKSAWLRIPHKSVQMSSQAKQYGEEGKETDCMMRKLKAEEENKGEGMIISCHLWLGTCVLTAHKYRE